VVVTADMCKYRSSVFSLLLVSELVLRDESVTCGGAIYEHFLDFLDGQWKAISVSGEFEQAFADPATTFSFRTPLSSARLCGVDPTTVPSIVEPLPKFDEILEAVDADDHTQAEEPPPRAGGDLSAAPHDAVLRIQSMRVEQATGSVMHRYTPAAHVQCLLMAQMIKPSASLSDVLSCAAAMLLPDDASRQVGAALKEGTCSLPSADVLRMDRCKLDLMSVIWRQMHFLHRNEMFFILVDASPQLGMNFLCVIEESFMVPTETTLSAWDIVVAALESNYLSEIDLCSSLGHGRAGLVKKGRNVGNLMLMKSRDTVMFHARRRKYMGCCSDQGTEKGIAGLPLDIFPKHAAGMDTQSEDAFLFTNMLAQKGLLHVLYDALETSCKNSSLCERWIDNLRTITSFVTDRLLIEKYKATCFEDDPGKADGVTVQKRVHIDWKWEFLSRALVELMPKLPELQQRVIAKKILKSDSTETLTNATVTHTEVSLKDKEFEPASELFWCIGKLMEESAKELETCDCHREMWRPGLKRKRRCRYMLKGIGKTSCCMMGRRLPWLIAVGKNKLLSNIKTVTSPKLLKLLGELPEPLKGQVIKALEKLRLDVVECLVDKLKHMDHAPWRAMGAMYSVIDGDIPRAQGFLQECIREYGEAVAAGNVKKMHRISRQLFDPMTSVRKDIDKFLAEGKELRNYSCLFVALLRYSLMPLVERKIEGVHAQIKSIGKMAMGIGMPYVCAVLRLRYHLDLLKKSAEFAAFVIREWHSRSHCDRILALRYDAPSLKNKSRAEKIRMIYQCSLEEQFEDTHQARTNFVHFRMATSSTRVAADTMPDDVNTSVSLFKDMLSTGHIFSIPRPLLDLCVPHPAPIPPTFRPVDIAVGTALAPVPDVTWDDSSSTLFRVVNTNPGARVITLAHHVDADRRHLMTVAFFQVENRASGSGSAKLVASLNMESMRQINLLPLVAHMQQALQQIAKWNVQQAASTPLVQICTPPALAMGSEPILPLPDAVREHEPSTALVPVNTDMTKNALLLFHKLAKLGAFVHQNVHVSLNRPDFSAIQEESIVALRDAGVVQADRDADSGHWKLAIHSQCCVWKMSYGLRHPVPLARLTSDRSLLQKSKLELILRLRQDGWVPEKKLVPATLAGPRFFAQQLTKPVAYFAALNDIDSICGAKAVQSIEHQRPAVYYKCLLALKDEALQQFLVALPTLENESHFKRFLPKALRDGLVDPAEGEPLPIEDLPEGLPDGGPDLPVVPSKPHGVEWLRCIVSAPPHFQSLRVYFDHFTSSSVTQRGYAECPICKTCRWKQCMGTRAQYCATMLAWARGCSIAGHDREKHRTWQPPVADVAEATASMKMEDF